MPRRVVDMKKLFILVLLVLVFGAGIFLFSRKKPAVSINSFADCMAAGLPVMESHPRQCRAPDGTLFTEDIGNEMEYADEIRLTNPRPNQTVIAPLEITGVARGPWFFEASFSAELLDANGKSLGVAIVSAEGDWMTEDFVSFYGELFFDTPETPNGTLVVKNANPSGLAEQDKKLTIPVYFDE
jgi:hypothetical protein